MNRSGKCLLYPVGVLLGQHLSENVLEDAAVLEVGQLDLSEEAEGGLERSARAQLHLHRLKSITQAQSTYGKATISTLSLLFRLESSPS